MTAYAKEIQIKKFNMLESYVQSDWYFLSFVM